MEDTINISERIQMRTGDMDYIDVEITQFADSPNGNKVVWFTTEEVVGLIKHMNEWLEYKQQTGK